MLLERKTGISAWLQVSLTAHLGKRFEAENPGAGGKQPGPGELAALLGGGAAPPAADARSPPGGRLAAARSPLPHSRVRGGVPHVAIGPITSPQGTRPACKKHPWAGGGIPPLSASPEALARLRPPRPRPVSGTPECVLATKFNETWEKKAMEGAYASRCCHSQATYVALRNFSTSLCRAGFASASVKGTCCSYSSLAWSLQVRSSISVAQNVTVQQCRQSSFFNTLTAEELWKGALAETGVGVKKGRGKRRKKKLKKNLNRGQEIGEGRSGFLWPGLNAPLIQSGRVQALTQRKKEERDKIQSEIIQQRDTWEKKRKIKTKREGGWSGKCWGGVLLDPPDPGPNGETYEDFETRVIEVKNVFCMKAKEGRKKSIRALVAVGNGKGAAGFALGKAGDRMNALRKAKNKAIRSLHFIELYQNHTIYHDVTVRFKRTNIRMKKQNKGYGLRCHRAIITICKLIGIKDLYAKVTGSKNLINITRALFKGLTEQETHQQLANQKNLYVVEFREEQGPLPIVVALPEGTVREDPEPEDEVPDTKLEWCEVKEAQGMKKSPWANVRRTVW